MEQEVGRFRLGAFLGRGASGDVYEGIDTDTGQRVAVKCVDCRRFRSIAELEAVQEEAVLLSSLRHRYIVRLLAVHVTSSHMYFAMEHAGGGTLDQLLRAKASKPEGGFSSFEGSREMPLLAAPAILLRQAMSAAHAAAVPRSLLQPAVPATQEGRQLGEPEALRIFLQIFQALDYCHRRCCTAT